MKKALKVESAFVPREVCQSHQPVCILVDAIRASCTIVTLFEKGYDRILLTTNEIESINKCGAITKEAYCICAEKIEGTKADHADVSPSLQHLKTFPNGNGRKVLFRTTNGTKGVRTIYDMGLHNIMIGCMLNKDAVAEAAIKAALQYDTGICVVSAGRENGNIYCIDDTYCCAMLIQKIMCYAVQRNIEIDLQDSAKIALNAAKQYHDTEEAYSESATGFIMREASTEEDIYLCAQENISKHVPYVAGVDEWGHVIIDLQSE